MNEQHKFPLDAFVWILQKSGRRRSTVLWYGNCAYSERNDINTEQLVFVSLKIKKKKEIKKIQPIPRVDRGTAEVRSTTELCRHQVQAPKKITILISINYKISDNSTGSSLYEDFLLVNFLVL